MPWSEAGHAHPWASSRQGFYIATSLAHGPPPFWKHRNIEKYVCFVSRNAFFGHCFSSWKDIVVFETATAFLKCFRRNNVFICLGKGIFTLIQATTILSPLRMGELHPTLHASIAPGFSTARPGYSRQWVMQPASTQSNNQNRGGGLTPLLPPASSSS